MMRKTLASALHRPVSRIRRRIEVARGAGGLQPLNREFDADRGRPIDRHYIENFLQRHADDISGYVLETGDDAYTHRYGGDRVTRSEVLHAVGGNPQATFVGNLETGEGVPRECVSCLVLTQTLQYINEARKAVRTCRDASARGGVLLATVSGISQISRYDMDRWGDYWRFSRLSSRKLFGEVFGDGNVRVETHGNVYAARAFLLRMAVEDLSVQRLDYRDPDYELAIAVRAVRT